MLRRILFASIALALVLLAPHSIFAASPDQPAVQSQPPNPPVLTSATFDSGTVSIGGKLNSIPEAVFRIDFYTSAACESSERTLLGSRDVFTDSVGAAYFFRVQFPAAGAGSFITATATSESGSTSAFSACRQVTPGITYWNLVLNPSFEENADANRRVPDAWTASWNGGRSWHSCGVTAMDDLCSAVAQMAGGYSRLTQTLNFAGGPGDKVSLYFWLEGSDVRTTSYVRMRLFFLNNGAVTQSRLLNLPTGSYNWQNKVIELTITQPFNAVKIEFQASNTSGTLWFDSMSLIFIDQ